MPAHRSQFYKDIQAHVERAYSDDEGWPAAKPWRTRVGKRRVAADLAIYEAWQLLKSIDPQVFRDDETENQEFLRDARKTLHDLYLQSFSVSWERFKGQR